MFWVSHAIFNYLGHGVFIGQGIILRIVFGGLVALVVVVVVGVVDVVVVVVDVQHLHLLKILQPHLFALLQPQDLFTTALRGSTCLT